MWPEKDGGYEDTLETVGRIVQKAGKFSADRQRNIRALQAEIEASTKDVAEAEKFRGYFETLKADLTYAPAEARTVSFKPVNEWLLRVESGVDSLSGGSIQPSSSTAPIFTTSVGGTANLSINLANDVARRYSDKPSVAEWANKIAKNAEVFGTREERAEQAIKRLSVLSRDLQKNYSEAQQATQVFDAGVTLLPISSVANAQRNLLYGFRDGIRALFAHNEKPKENVTFLKAAERFAVDIVVTQETLAKCQEKYEDLHGVLSNIGKNASAQPVTGKDMVAILERIEALIIEATGALDPTKTGKTFV